MSANSTTKSSIRSVVICVSSSMALSMPDISPFAYPFTRMVSLIALAPLFGIVSSFFDPAYQAIMPQLVEAEELSSVNSLNTLSRNLGFLLGPVLGADCITLFGPASAFAFDGLTFFCSALCLLALHLP